MQLSIAKSVAIYTNSSESDKDLECFYTSSSERSSYTKISFLHSIMIATKPPSMYMDREERLRERDRQKGRMQSPSLKFLPHYIALVTNKCFSLRFAPQCPAFHCITKSCMLQCSPSVRNGRSAGKFSPRRTGGCISVHGVLEARTTNRTSYRHKGCNFLDTL